MIAKLKKKSGRTYDESLFTFWLLLNIGSGTPKEDKLPQNGGHPPHTFLQCPVSAFLVENGTRNSLSRGALNNFPARSPKYLGPTLFHYCTSVK